MGSLEAPFLILLFRNSCHYPSIPLDIQGHLLRFGIWTPKRYLKHRTSGGNTGCLGYPSPNLTNQYHTLLNWQYISLIYHLYTTYSPCLLGGYMPPTTIVWEPETTMTHEACTGSDGVLLKAGGHSGHSPSGRMAEIQPSTSCYGKYPHDLHTKLILL